MKTKLQPYNYCVTFLGETCAGKTTLINKILEKNIFEDQNDESTSTICKIRNSEAVKIIAKSKDGKIDEIDLSEVCDLNSDSGVEILQTALADLTDMTKSEGSVNFEYVDVGMPIPFLKVLTY